MRGAVSYTIFLVFILTSCTADDSKQNYSRASIPESALQVDFVEELSRHDSAEICARETKDVMIGELGYDFLSDDHFKLMCDCNRDALFFELQQLAPNQNQLHNAIVQVSTNFEVTKKIFNKSYNPNGYDSFQKFLENDAEHTLGFNALDFHALVKKTASITGSNSYDLAYLSANIPSCAEAVTQTKKRFPTWDPSTGSTGLDRIFEKL